MTVVVSLHDVSPAHDSAVRRLWTLCRDHGIVPALLVVPNWHGAWPLADHPTFGRWVRECASHGSDILLHGLRHDEVGVRRRLRDHWRAMGRTDREGEFLTLDTAEAQDRIRCGRDVLTSVGLEPVGFVPPAWLARRATVQAARQLGFQCTEDSDSVHLLQSGVRVKAPACRWSGRSAVRARGSAIVARGRRLFQRRRPWVRLALHPSDLDHRSTFRSVQWALSVWSSDHPIATYREMLEEVA